MKTDQVKIAKAMVRLDIIKRQVEMLELQIANIEKEIDEKATKAFKEEKLQEKRKAKSERT